MRATIVACLVLAASASAQANPLCSADFSFDGNLSDSGANAYHGQMIAAGGALAGPLNFATGKSGQALRLDGNAALRIPVDLNYELCPQVTISAWFYMENPTTQGREYLLSTGDGSGVRMYRDRQNFVASGGRGALNQNVVRSNLWIFVAVVWDYQAGTLTMHWGNRSAEAALNPQNLVPGLPELYVGAFDDGVQSQYTVKATLIDDLRITGTALDATAIAALRTQSRESPPIVAANGACHAACSPDQVCYDGGCYGPCADDGSRLCRHIEAASPAPGAQLGLASGSAGAYQSPAAELLSPSADGAVQPPSGGTLETGGLTSMAAAANPGSGDGRMLGMAGAGPMAPSSGIRCETGVCPIGQQCWAGMCYVRPQSQIGQSTQTDTRTPGQKIEDGVTNVTQGTKAVVNEVGDRLDEYADTHMEYLDPYRKAAECKSIWGLAEKVRDDLAGAAAAVGCKISPLSWIKVVDCLKVKKKVQEFDNASLDLWNILVANGGWATVGPRKLELGAPETGNIAGVFTRTWVTFDYLDTDSVRLEISEPEDSGKLMTDVRICKVDKQGAITLLAQFVLNDDSQSRGLTEFVSRKFDDLTDRQLIVTFKGTGLPDPGRRFPYTIEAIPLIN